MQELLELLKEVLPNVDWEAEKSLVDDGVLDSIDIITIISEINEAYDVVIPAEEIVPENFNSAQALYSLIERLADE